MRERVFANDPNKRAYKLAEIDRVMATLTKFKDELKLLTPVQGRLVESERKVEYG